MAIKHIIVDVYQPPEFRTQMEQAFDNVEVKALGAHKGDVSIELDNKEIRIETKESDDFLASVLDKRIFTQAEGMRQLTPFAFVLYKDFHFDKEGKIILYRNGKYQPSNWTVDHIDGVLTAIQARGVFTRIARHGFISSIKRIIDWVEGAENGSVTRDLIKLSPFDTHGQAAVNLISFFDGIGVDKAKSLIEWAGKDKPLHEYWRLAITPFDSDNRPKGWNNSTIARHRKQLGYRDNPKTEWVEELP